MRKEREREREEEAYTDKDGRKRSLITHKVNTDSLTTTATRATYYHIIGTVVFVNGFEESD